MWRNSRSSLKMADLDLFFKVTEANKGKKLASQYLHTYNLYYFHTNTSDPYDEMQGQVQRWVTLTYFVKVTEANTGKSFVFTISPHLQFVLLPYYYQWSVWHVWWNPRSSWKIGIKHVGLQRWSFWNLQKSKLLWVHVMCLYNFMYHNFLLNDQWYSCLLSVCRRHRKSRAVITTRAMKVR